MDRGTAIVSIETPVRRYPPIRLALAGRHQADNALVAVRVLEELERRGVRAGAAAVQTALAEARWPARLEWIRLRDGGELLIDAAHNPSGARALASYLEDAGVGRLPIVIAAMRDKQVSAMIDALAAASLIWIATEAASPRSRSAEALAADIRAHASVAGGGVDRRVDVLAVPNPLEAVSAALDRHPRAVAAGSIYMVGPLRAALLEAGAMLSS
jgi:dihydrofolate synthase/folylpolyglutamate synthase